MAGEKEELNKLEVQRKVNFAGSLNIEHTCEPFFHLVSQVIKPFFHSRDIVSIHFSWVKNVSWTVLQGGAGTRAGFLF